MIVLFACIENSCRSQIAEALGKNISQGKIEFYSAGSKPSGVVTVSYTHLTLPTILPV